MLLIVCASVFTLGLAMNQSHTAQCTMGWEGDEFKPRAHFISLSRLDNEPLSLCPSVLIEKILPMLLMKLICPKTAGNPLRVNNRHYFSVLDSQKVGARCEECHQPEGLQLTQRRGGEEGQRRGLRGGRQRRGGVGGRHSPRRKPGHQVLSHYYPRPVSVFIRV